MHNFCLIIAILSFSVILTLFFMASLQVLVPHYLNHKRQKQVEEHLNLLSMKLADSESISVVTEFCWNVIESLFSQDAIPSFSLHHDMGPYCNLIQGPARIVNLKFSEWYIIKQGMLIKNISVMLCSMDIKESDFFFWMTTSLKNILLIHSNMKDGLLNLDDLERIRSQINTLNDFIRTVNPPLCEGLLIKEEDVERNVISFETLCCDIQNLLFKEIPSKDSKCL